VTAKLGINLKMEKQKRWQFFLIIAVVVLTIYNILPTLFYYTKPLKSPINEKRAHEVALSIVNRTNALERESIDWLKSFCSQLKTKPTSIDFDKSTPNTISIAFKNNTDADKFREYLPKAGTLIPFVPAQLSLLEEGKEGTSKRVAIKRRIPIHFDQDQLDKFYQFSTKINDRGQVTDLYRALVNDRALQIGVTLGGPSENALLLNSALKNPQSGQSQEILYSLAQNILSFVKTFGENSPLAKRYFASFTQLEEASSSELAGQFLKTMELLFDKIKLERIALQEEEKTLQDAGGFLETAKQQRLDLLTSREKLLSSALEIIRREQQAFSIDRPPLNYATLGASLQKGALEDPSLNAVQTVSLKDHNPFIDRLLIDWKNEKIYLQLQPDLLTLKKQSEELNAPSQVKQQLDRFLYDMLASFSRRTGEKITPFQDEFVISLNELEDSKSFLCMRLSKIAEAEAKELQNVLITTWNPKHRDLKKEVFPILDYQTFLTLPMEEQKLGLIIYAPSLFSKMPAKGFRMNSIYVIAKGMDKIIQKARMTPNSEASQQLIEDFNHLQQILQHNGFLGYTGASYNLSPEFANDFIFEAEDYFQTILAASRENFTVHGTKRYAVLEFSNVEQRILTQNKIETRMHEDLMKWRDDYLAAQLKMKNTSPYDIPPPTRNVLWDNFKLSLFKYFRGDERKVLHWGLDLSGGKTVQIELRDHNQRQVKDEADIKQAINELYNRVNKMGVSEVNIRKEGDFITLDFPGSQGLSAAELVKASSMYFHVVNEKFTPNNPLLSEHVNHFLQEVWNEAVVTNRKEEADINLVAWQHLYGETGAEEMATPRSESAKILYDNGLRLSLPGDESTSNSFNDSFSRIALFRGSDFTDWYGQTHPLLIIFRNYALEGANLEDVHASYDPSKGNYLAFRVKSSSQAAKGGQKFKPQDDLLSWTSQFAKEKILGTPNEAYSHGKGWRMAVILNGTIISAPTLDSPLNDSAMITGSFTQREVNQLEADLKAGSLSFTPRILSEKNVSPELSAHERNLGIIATGLALLLVIFCMVGYYRFAGVVACVAVFVNLFIIWATLQNIQATLTLATIAGVILTLGMAVDANVLVFERVREEFAISGRIASAIHSGYKKAFSAIIDSNLTTLIAALILLHFDSGPIKGLAITLIIGIISSLFTALFMTRYFFAGWVQNPDHKALNMLNFIKSAHFDFLKRTKLTMLLSTVMILIGGVFLVKEHNSLLGMDFKGGYALTFELQATPDDAYRQKVEKALLAQGLSLQEFQIRELTPSSHLRLFLSKNLNQSGKPFYNLLANPAEELSYPYESNQKIVWIVNTLEKANLSLTPQSLQHLDTSWTEVSGQMSDTMRNQAILGLLIALVCIMIYITLRFEFKYAISATLCLAHDLIFTVAMIAILHAFGVPIQIDMITITALMTIVGYSLNDTIIVFDRIREDVRLMRKSTLDVIINHALNVTLSRTLMTSGTTLLVLAPLVALGGSTIFGFALVMIIGVVFGTLSSLFIAAPLMRYFHQKELERQQVTTSSA
jgi:SecD/SecF fusion protein